jgi:Xaa-Pro aminopeptidase
VKEAHDKDISAVAPGVKFADIDLAARRVLERAGLGKYFRHGTGHGVGLAVHEAPSISPRGEGVVEAGMVFTVEPGVYIPNWGGVRIEDMVEVTSHGCKLITGIPKELQII